MNGKRRTAAIVAAWTTVGVIGIGSVGVAMAADSGSASPTASATGSAQPGGTATKAHGLRARALHGDFVVQTKTGLATVELQKGTVTAVSTTSVTVKSSDGFTVTWTINDKTKVRKDKAAATSADLTSGVMVRVIGPKDGDTATARLIGIGATSA